MKRGLSPSAAQFPYGWWNGPEFNFVETPMQTPLQVAAFYGAQDSIKLLLKAGADINARPDWKVLIRRSEYNLPSRTPLHAAVMSFRNQSETPGVKPSLGFIKFLLSVGANPQLIDWNRETALDLAKRLKLPEVVKLLER